MAGEGLKVVLRQSASSSLLVRVDRVAEPVAEEREGEHDEHHRHHRQQQPGIERHRLDVLRLRKEHAPAGDRRPQAEAEEGQRRLRQDHRRDRERRGGDQVAGEVRHEVPADDAARLGAHHLRRGDVILLAERKELRAHRARDRRPVEERQDDA